MLGPLREHILICFREHLAVEKRITLQFTRLFVALPYVSICLHMVTQRIPSSIDSEPGSDISPIVPYGMLVLEPALRPVNAVVDVLHGLGGSPEFFFRFVNLLRSELPTATKINHSQGTCVQFNTCANAALPSWTGSMSSRMKSMQIRQ